MESRRPHWTENSLTNNVCSGEEKPSCFNCTRARRKCDYTRLVPAIFEGAGDSDESRALHLYREGASRQMSGYFDGPFWNATVMQISHDLPAVKHILMATGSAFEQAINAKSTVIAAPREFALTQTAKSIERLINDKSTSIVTILICAVIFSAYGNIVDDLSGFQHIKSALDIIREIQKDPDNHPQLTSLSASEKALVQNVLAPMVWRSAHSLSLLDPVFATTQAIKDGIIAHSDAPAIPHSFANMRDAEECHVILFEWACGLLQPAETSSGHELPEADASNVWRMSDRFVEAVDRLIAHLVSTADARAVDIAQAGDLLKLSHYGFRICFKSINFSTECEFDNLEDDFRAIIDCSRSYLLKLSQKDSLMSRNLNFGTDHSFLIPLFLVCKSARDPVLRRQAIQVMAAAEISEGSIGSRSCASAAVAAMHAEELGLGTIRTASDVPELNRIRVHSATFFAYVSDNMRVRLRYSRYPYIPNMTNPVTEAMWLNLSRKRPSPWEGFNMVPEYDLEGPIPTPLDLDDIMADDFRAEKYPGMSMTWEGIAWSDLRRTPPSYQVLRPSMPFFYKQALKF